MGKIYKKNFLENVIFRIDFEPIGLANLESLTKSVNKIFPVVEQQQGFEGEFAFNIADGQVIQEKREVISWLLSNKDKTKKMTVGPRSLFIVYDKYKNSEELLSDIKNVVSVFLSAFNVKTVNRVGLRYSNRIRIEDKNPLDWSKYIQPELLGSLNFVTKNKLKIARSMSQLTIKGEDYDLNFNYGIFNDGFPSEVSTRDFVLDYDCYSKFPIDSTELNIEERTKDYNEVVKSLFLKSVTKEYLNYLDK